MFHLELSPHGWDHTLDRKKNYDDKHDNCFFSPLLVSRDSIITVFSGEFMQNTDTSLVRWSHAPRRLYQQWEIIASSNVFATFHATAVLPVDMYSKFIVILQLFFSNWSVWTMFSEIQAAQIIAGAIAIRMTEHVPEHIVQKQSEKKTWNSLNFKWIVAIRCRIRYIFLLVSLTKAAARITESTKTQNSKV